jgi:thiol-disulfide isomerase/thioredoxin
VSQLASDAVTYKQIGARTLVVAAIAIAGVVAVTVLAPADPVGSYDTDAKPLDLPTSQLAAVTKTRFDGILAGLRGTPVVVNLWASWCAPCRAEMPLLQRAAEDYDGRIVFLGVDSKDRRAEAEKFLDDVGVDYPSVFDATGEVRTGLGLRGFPTTYFFDAEGNLVASLTGGITEPKLAAQLRDLAG